MNTERSLSEILDDALKNGIPELTLDEEIRFGGECERVFDRLHKLAWVGYKPNWSERYTDSIWLYHPRESFKHRVLILHASGLITSTADQELRLYRIDKKGFDQFIQSVPKPNWWDRTGETRANIVAWGVLLFWIGAFGLAAHLVTSWLGIR